MYCKYCGKPIDEDSAFCRHCGKRQTEDNSIVEDEPKYKTKETKEILPQKRKNQVKNNSRNALFIFCGGLLILIAIIAWVVCTFQDDDKKIADISIDKISKELAEATNNYDKLYSFHEGLARVCKDNKYGFIDKLGHEIIPCKYDDADDFDGGVAIINIGGKEGGIDKNGSIVIPVIYDIIHWSTKDSLLPAKKDEKWGYINRQGEIAISFEYDDCNRFKEGRAEIRQNGKIGFIDENGNIVIPCQYYETYDGRGFSEGLVGVRKDKQWGYLDKYGNIAIPFQDGLTGMPFCCGLSTIKRGGLISYRISVEGHENIKQEPFEMAFINKQGNLASEWHHGTLSEIRDTYFRFTNGENGKEGLQSIYGKIVIPDEYDLIANGFSDDGLVYVSRNGEGVGFYDINKGKLVIPCIYKSCTYEFRLCEGLVALKKDGKAGFVNADNIVIIPFVYDDAYEFSEGFAVVERFGKFGYVDRYGNDTFNIK